MVTDNPTPSARPAPKSRSNTDVLRRAAEALLEVLDRQSVVVREAECVARLRTALGQQR